MSKVGDYLKQVRIDQDRSRRWVERRSRQLHDQSDRHISHSYLRQIEDGNSDNPSRDKLRTLAQIYSLEEGYVLDLAGLLAPDEVESQPESENTSRTQGSEMDVARKLIEVLESRGIHPVYFFNSVSQLSDESLHLVNRLITTLSVQERQLLDQKEQTAPLDPAVRS